MKSVFVTVGTTEFESLVIAASSDAILQLLKKLGYSQLTLQIGRGQTEPISGIRHGVNVDFYRTKDSLNVDMSNADLIISHAGGGTCLEVLEMGKPLIVVVNDTLMHNHQVELAKELSDGGHLHYCTPASLAQALKEFNPDSLKPWTKGEPTLFSDWIDRYFT